ncbi:MAG: Stp1/IreP family PP2C-type Ser/Thr phosphatase [Rubrivivax sp.]|jgi:serine/threonine protein phosphatase PrpC
MTLEFASALDVGRARANNEDSVALDSQAQLAVLADGMGGYNAGEVAASMATSLVSSSLVQWLAGHTAPTVRELAQAMGRSVNQANRAIFDAAVGNPRYRGMGTTLVMVVVARGQLVVGHVGDSRAYRLRGRRLQRLTRDHSLLQEQLDAGLITPAQAARSPHRNLVTRALGVEAEVTLEAHDYSLKHDDLLLLCSDGLTDMVDDERICGLLCHTRAGLQDACHALVEAANAAGGRDNISVVLVRAGAESLGHDKRWSV